MVKDWMAIVAAAGFDPMKMSTEQLYEISGKIIHDPVIGQRKLEIARAGNGVIEKGTTEKILRSMTAAERTALRERVSGVLKFPEGVKA
jgi:hypothetical protein